MRVERAVTLCVCVCVCMYVEGEDEGEGEGRRERGREGEGGGEDIYDITVVQRVIMNMSPPSNSLLLHILGMSHHQ